MGTNSGVWQRDSELAHILEKSWLQGEGKTNQIPKSHREVAFAAEGRSEGHAWTLLGGWCG